MDQAWAVRAVLTIGEAAVRLALSRAGLEPMIAAGQVEALPGEFAPFVPTREVERLTTAWSG